MSNNFIIFNTKNFIKKKDLYKIVTFILINILKNVYNISTKRHFNKSMKSFINTKNKKKYTKKNQKGLGYENVVSQMNANQSYTPSIKEVMDYNKKIMKNLDIPSLCGGGFGSNIQLYSSSPKMITPNTLLNYTFNIMNKLSSKEPPLDWTTNYKNGSQMADALKLKSLAYDLNIQKKLQQNGGYNNLNKCSIDNNKLKIFIYNIIQKNDINKLNPNIINNIYLTLDIITPIIYELLL